MKQDKYLEIRSSEVAANKIHKHLKHLLATRPRFYKKTLVRYKDLAYLLIDCVDLILKFLTNELLSSSGDNEFDELTDDASILNSDDDVVEIRRKLTESTQLFDTYNQLTTNSVISPIVAESSNLDVDCTAMTKTYSEVLHDASLIDFGYEEVNDCAKLIYYWYSHRIRYMSMHHRAYQITQLPAWICGIVLMYGKYHANGQPTFFANTLKKWCDDANDVFSNKYTVPKEITNLIKSSYMNDYTADALIIYDLLMEKGYLPLVNPGVSVVPLDPNYLVALTKEHNPSLDKLIKTRFAKRDEYIKEIGLTPTNAIDLSVNKEVDEA